jgi:transcription elongation factor GreA
MNNIDDQQERNILTKEGVAKIEAELEERRTKIREEIANKLELATEQGDLSENAAYKAALEEKELNESRIQELEQTLSKVEIVEANNSDPSAGVGDKVTVKDIETGKDMTFTLVATSESEPVEGKVSIESPVGRALYGKFKGAEVQITLPHKLINYKLIKIN